MQCYLCNSKIFKSRKGEVRDAPKKFQILQCEVCGLVMLDDTNHIPTGFYENSGMHGSKPISMESWLKETDWDDQRRFEMIQAMLPNKRLLDFGCGAGGFLQKARTLAADVTGIELETRVQDYWASQIHIVPSLEAAASGEKYDLITAFHVVEHLSDPRAVIKGLANLLRPQGRIIVEVPSAEDALLTLYDCDAFQRFTYWSQHLFLFNAATLATLATQAGQRVIAIQNLQRYPLSNHLYWLSKGQPGGHKHWAFMDTSELTYAYANTLSQLGKTDTLIAHLEKIA
ncbi:MAG: class I SAM-dependent methyltransferase [Magnetococcales bacterium]|nr:class I SAM-dependent methyltransferase [Magnetococcales bacterium]